MNWRTNSWWQLASGLTRFNLLRTAGDVVLLGRIVVVALLVPLLMRRPLARVRHVIEPRVDPRSVGPAEAHRVLWLLNLALEGLRPLLRTTCLTRGITRYYFLRRAGVDVSLAFGIARPGLADVSGHCWLIKDGEPFLERRDPRPVFAELYRISPAFAGARVAAC